MTDKEEYEEWWRRRLAWEFAPVKCEQLPDGSWLARKAGLVGVGPTKYDAIGDVREKLEMHHARPGKEYLARAPEPKGEGDE